MENMLSENLRKTILSQALTIFRKEGISGHTPESLARKLDVSISTLNELAGSVEDLFY